MKLVRQSNVVDAIFSENCTSYAWGDLMDISNTIIRMLEHMDRPGFIVKDGIILYANQASAKLNIEQNTPVKDLLLCDYTPSAQGMQSLKLTLPCGQYDATVESMDNYELFVLEHDSAINELRALALASQQLRSPLTTLMHSLDENDTVISRSIHQLHRAISNMSDAYRYKIFRIPELVPTEIRSFMDELIESVTVRLSSLGIEITYQGLNTDYFCGIDRELLERCVLNLVSNAVLAESTKIHISLTRTEKQLLLTVDDNGCGVPAHMHSHMFCNFQRDPELTCESGLGLGMQIVQAAAQAHNGTVLMEHRDNGGIRITVTLTVTKSAPSVRSPKLRYDYLGGRDHILTELSDILPETMY